MTIQNHHLFILILLMSRYFIWFDLYGYKALPCKTIHAAIWNLADTESHSLKDLTVLSNNLQENS